MASGLSVFDLFKIGIGPSSSRTVGPMLAAWRFAGELRRADPDLERVSRIRVDLYGSLALTGRGHATDKAVILGLRGERPDEVDADRAEEMASETRRTGTLPACGREDRRIPFQDGVDLLFHMQESLPRHPNGLRFAAIDGSGTEWHRNTYYSVGGGFVVSEGEAEGLVVASAGGGGGSVSVSEGAVRAPLEFKSAGQLLGIGLRTGLSVAGIARENERARRSDAEIDAGLDRIREAMFGCVERGCRASEGSVLPGGLNVPRRAPRLFRELSRGGGLGVCGGADPLLAMDWVNLYALAVNEENAAGGRVVTAPTNGAAGVIPAVLKYYATFVPGATEAGTREFLLTAGAIGMLYKTNASLSAAEVGCQGEVGVASSMAAAGLAAVMGGTNAQIDNAAEIAMEHHLGMTCDPIGGLVQVPCIERNTMGAAKAINAARLALRGDGTHLVSLDKVIATMHRTGLDMQAKYKETSLGGLAVNLVEC